MKIYKITEASGYLAEDIMKILTCYSARYYGARGGRKKKNQAENTPVESNGI
jgi:predicted site-specific integrase-resolvase